MQANGTVQANQFWPEKLRNVKYKTISCYEWNDSFLANTLWFFALLLFLNSTIHSIECDVVKPTAV